MPKASAVPNLPALRPGNEHAAIVFEGRTVGYGELFGWSQAWAAALRQAGVRRGDRVAALAPASPAVIAAMLGTYQLGALWVPINPRYVAPEVEHVLRDSGARLLALEPSLGQLAPAPPCAVIPIGAVDVAPAGPPIQRSAEPDPNALLIYTSGTTGKSKGVILSHRAVDAAIGSLTRRWGWSRADTLSLALPLFHVHGLCIGVHGSLQHGMTMRLAAKFDPAVVVADFVQGNATIFMGVPTMYTRLLKHVAANPAAARGLQGARLFTAGSAALAADDLARFEAATGHRIVERYGMSETLITLSNPLDGERRAGAVGTPIDGVVITVVDGEGKPVEDGTAGELLVQTPGMMTGYFGQPEATAAAFVGPWFRTGDLVVREPDGYVRILGRLSVDIIKSGGFKIAAREIEEVLALHPAVAEVAVFGVPDPQWGECVAAAVVLTPQTGMEPEALVSVLRAHCQGKIADYKRPRHVQVMAALPRNAMGKVLKVALRRRAQALYAPADSR